MKAVIVGHDFRFGARAAGDLDTLADLGRRLGFTTEGFGLLHTGEIRYSSSYVRSCLAAGDVTAAAAALGRPHRVVGVLAVERRLVLRGEERGVDRHVECAEPLGERQSQCH